MLAQSTRPRTGSNGSIRPRSKGFARGIGPQSRKEQEDSCKTAYAKEYYRQKITRKYGRHFWWLAFCFLLQLVAVVTSETFLNNVFQKDAAGIFLVLLVGVTSVAAMTFQWRDARLPSVQAKVLHTALSVISSLANVALAAYGMGIGGVGPVKVVGRLNNASALLTTVRGLFISGTSVRLTIKGLSDGLQNAGWAEYFSLLFGQVPPKRIMWDTLPDNQKVWALQSLLDETEKVGKNKPGVASEGLSGDPDPPSDDSPQSAGGNDKGYNKREGKEADLGPKTSGDKEENAPIATGTNINRNTLRQKKKRRKAINKPDEANVPCR